MVVSMYVVPAVREGRQARFGAAIESSGTEKAGGEISSGTGAMKGRISVKKPEKWDKKNSFFQKRTGEVIDSKEKWPENEPERTEKRSGEVVENTRVHKKRTESNRKTNRAKLLKIKDSKKEGRAGF